MRKPLFDSMRTCLSAAIALTTFAAVIALTTPGQAATQCPIAKSTYQAIGNPSFELQFSPIKESKIATEILTFSLQHRQRGAIANYNLGGSSGYGSFYLRDLAKPIEADADIALKPVFFDANWRNVIDISGKSAPQYLFISGLGVTDWYADRPDNRTQPLGDVMWQFARCAR
jgi:hypothetical protein